MQRGYKTFTSLRAAIVSVAICLVFMLLMGVNPLFPGFYTAAVAVMVLPVYLLLCGFLAGLWPTALCLAITLGTVFAAGGAMTAGCVALYLVPAMGIFALCLWHKKPFWVTCGQVLGAFVLSQLAVYAILQGRTGGELYAYAANSAAQAIGELPSRDMILYMLYNLRYLSIPESMRDTALVALEGGGYVFSEEMAREFLLQVRSIVMQLLHGMVPSMLISGNALNVLMGISFGIHFGRRANARRAFKRDEPEQDFPDLAMPPLAQWHIPSPWGARIGVLAAGYLLMNLSGNDVLFLLGALMWQTFLVCFGVQGLAAVNAMQKQRGTKKGWRTAVIIGAMTVGFVQTALTVIGVMDQITNARGLRKGKTPRNEEE